jgi:hypothetical protein
MGFCGSAWTNPPFYGNLFLAFVALVLPFDSCEGAAKDKLCSLFYGLEAVSALGGWGVISLHEYQDGGPREAKQFY